MSSNKIVHTAGAVMAGGKSTRMGRDKSLIELAGQTLLERAVEKMARVFEVVMVSGSGLKVPSGIEPVEDILAGGGPLSGIHAVLSRSPAERVMVVPCDSPFVPESFLRGMAEMADEWDVLVPEIDGFFEPLHGVYSKACRPVAERMIKEGRYKIFDMYEHVRSKMVEKDVIEALDPDGLAFFNINTEADLNRAERLARRG